jgi:hypothetical protein
MTLIVYKEESYKIIGACMNVHKKLGHGFLESVYAEALELEFYNDRPLKKFFKVDFVCYKSIIVELKATNFITETDCKQALNYLKATNFELALLINFSTPSLTYKRILN